MQHHHRWLRKCMATTLGLLVSMAALAQEDISLCQQGWTSYSAGKYDEALALYGQCMQTGKLTPATLARSYRNMGMAYNAKKDGPRAVDAYNKALALKPEDPWFDYVNRGNAWSDQKEYDKALADYEAALQAKPDLGAAIFNRGIVQERLGKPDLAKADFALAYAKGYRAAALTERMTHYQLPSESSVALDRNKPFPSTELLNGMLLQMVKESNGQHSCFEKQVSLDDVRARLLDSLGRQGIAAPTPNQLTWAFYTLYPCPFSPYRVEMKAATQKDLEGAWLMPESSYRYRFPAQSPNWKQDSLPNLKTCEGIGFYPAGEMRVVRRSGAAGTCPFHKVADMEIARLAPPVVSWNMLRNGRLNVSRTDVANHVEEWDIFIATVDFEAMGLAVKQGDVLAYLRKVPGNEWNIATKFWHLQKLPQ